MMHMMAFDIDDAFTRGVCELHVDDTLPTCLLFRL